MTTLETAGVRDRAYVTDAQTRAEVARIGQEIAARIVKVDEAKAAIKEKAGREVKDVIDHADSIEKLLAEAKGKCKAAGMTFEEFRKEYAPDYSRAKVYELIALGKGTLMIEDKRASAAKRKRTQRERDAAKADKPPASRDDLSEQQALYDKEVGIVGRPPRVTGSQAIPIEQRQAEMARLADETPPVVEHVEPIALTAEEAIEPHQLPTAEEISFHGLGVLRARIETLDLTPDDALSALKAMADYVMPRLDTNAAIEARKYIGNMPMWEKARAKLLAKEKKAA